MSESELIEQLADKEHASWARWMQYLFSKCEKQPDGSLVIPYAYVVHWQRQTDTPYEGLSDREQQSDRDEVAHILPIIEKYVKEPAMSIEERERAPDKLDQQISKVHVLATDISGLMTRARDGTFASIIAYVEVQEEIHDLQHTLADWESYLSAQIAEKAAEHALMSVGTKVRMQAGTKF